MGPEWMGTSGNHSARTTCPDLCSFARGGLFPSEKTANLCQPTCPTCPVGFRARQSLKNFGPRMPENSRSRKRLHPSRRSSMFRTSPLLRSVVRIKGSRMSPTDYILVFQYVCAYPTGSCPACPLCTIRRSSRAAPTSAIKST